MYLRATRIIPDAPRSRPRFRCSERAAISDRIAQGGAFEAHEVLGVGLVRNADLSLEDEACLRVRADRGRVLHRGPDHADVAAVEGEGDVPEERAQHRGAVSLADE